MKKHKQNKIYAEFFKSKAVRCYLCVLAVIVLACLFAPVLATDSPNQANLSIKFQKISKEHLLGTDYMGRDLFSRILWGGRNTLGAAAIVTMISAVMGTFIGMFSGCAGKTTDGVIMKCSDILRSFPGVVLVFIVVSIRGVGMVSVCMAMLLTRWIWYARMARNLTKKEREKTSILASRLAGSSWWKILRRHLFPAILPEMLSVLALDFGGALLSISGYSFLGLGILPPEPEWGMMINDGRNYMDHPEMMFWPGLCVVLVVVSVNFLGDKLRDLLEEKRS